MHGIEKGYCDVCIGAVIAAFRSIMESPAAQVLNKVRYGKGDTLGLDAIPEITISQRIKNYDRYGILVTEEFETTEGVRWPIDPDPIRQPLMLFSDPTDRSKQFQNSVWKFLKAKKRPKLANSLKQLIQLKFGKKFMAGQKRLP